MRKVVNGAALGAAMLALGGCVGPVNIAPLPYAHPANPEASAGAMPAIGSALTSAPSDDGLGAEHGSRMSHGQKCGAAMSKKGNHEDHGR